MNARGARRTVVTRHNGNITARPHPRACPGLVVPGEPPEPGVVPAGTANQLADVLGVPSSLEKAAAALETAGPRTIDLGEVTLRLVGEPEGTTTMTIGCGAGLDARIMATTPPAWKQRVGRWAYLVQGLKLVARLDAAPYRLTVDGRTIETDASIALAFYPLIYAYVDGDTAHVIETEDPQVVETMLQALP